MRSYNIYLSVLAGLTIVACDKESERSSRLETASNPPAGTDRAPAQSESVSQPAASDSYKPAPAPAVKPARAAAAARPSGPANTRPARDTTRPAAPTADSSASGRETPAPASTGPDSEYLKYDAATNTVTFELIGGPRGFQFNGYASGGATLTLPPKANVVINFINKDGTPHSAEVISGEGPPPNAATDAAIPRAYTNQLLQGLPQEGTDVIRFPAPESGTYRIFCGVPGHGLSGMWIWMKVDPAAKQPSFGPTKS